LNSLCPWRSRIMAGQYRSVRRPATGSAREMFVSGAARPYL
jgi:hypothetical protein